MLSKVLLLLFRKLYYSINSKYVSEDRSDFLMQSYTLHYCIQVHIPQFLPQNPDTSFLLYHKDKHPHHDLRQPENGYMYGPVLSLSLQAVWNSSIQNMNPGYPTLNSLDTVVDLRKHSSTDISISHQLMSL